MHFACQLLILGLAWASSVVKKPILPEQFLHCNRFSQLEKCYITCLCSYSAQQIVVFRPDTAFRGAAPITGTRLDLGSMSSWHWRKSPQYVKLRLKFTLWHVHATCSTYMH